MHIETNNLRLSSPLSSSTKIFKDEHSIDEEYLYHRLNAVLFTLQAQKQDFQEKATSEKKLLQEQISFIQSTLKICEAKNSKLQQECRQLRFNSHQRGSVVDYLKKKITVIESKFETEKEQMISVIKYLQSRNSQLNEMIFQLKSKQAKLSQNLLSMRQKCFNLHQELCNKARLEDFKNLLPFNNEHGNSLIPPQTSRGRITTQRRSLCIKTPTLTLTPQYMQNKYKKQSMSKLDCTKNMPFFSRQKNSQLQFNSFQQSNNESLAESSVAEKTIKYEPTVNRVKSQEDFDFLKVNNKRLDKFDIQNQDINQLLSGRRILINNYGHLSLTDCQGEEAKKAHQMKRMSVSNRPKISLPSNGRYVKDLIIGARTKQV